MQGLSAWLARKKIEDFGSIEAWQKDFMATKSHARDRLGRSVPGQCQRQAL